MSSDWPRTVVPVVLLALAGLPDGPARASSGRYSGQALPPTATIDRIVIRKSRGLLQAWHKKQLLKTYRVSVGRGGLGPKRYEGDNKTPEGKYSIDRRFASSRYHRFLHIDYPNSRDRQVFRSGKANGLVPRGKRIGGAIGIHGQRKGFGWLPHKWLNWTRGCIVLDNDEVEELYRFVVHGAIVVIQP